MNTPKKPAPKPASKPAPKSATRSATKAASTPALTKWTEWPDMPIDEFERRIEQFRGLSAEFVSKVTALFPGNIALTDDDKAHAPRLKLGTTIAPNETEPYGEHDVFLAAFQVARKIPEAFKGLADQDRGMDPNSFEVDLLEERVRKHKKLTLAARQIAPVMSILTEGPLWLAMQFNDPARAAYQLAKNLAQVDKKVAGPIMARGQSYYSGIAKTAAASRAANKKAKGA